MLLSMEVLKGFIYFIKFHFLHLLFIHSLYTFTAKEYLHLCFLSTVILPIAALYVYRHVNRRCVWSHEWSAMVVIKELAFLSRELMTSLKKRKKLSYLHWFLHWYLGCQFILVCRTALLSSLSWLYTSLKLLASLNRCFFICLFCDILSRKV